MEKTLRIKTILTEKPLNREILVQGWLKSKRDSKGLSFLDVTDGILPGRPAGRCR